MERRIAHVKTQTFSAIVSLPPEIANIVSSDIFEMA
jgi:hypothetical protein